MDASFLNMISDRASRRVSEIVEQNRGAVTSEYRDLLFAEYLVEETVKECARLAYALTEDEFVENDMLEHCGVKHG